MKKEARCYGVIPARYGSTRFKGKALADILGKPMFWHVYTRSLKCPEIDHLLIATDDERIFNEALKYGFHVTMTDTCHPSGTDRVLEAARQLGVREKDIVINIQGDEPALNPEMLSQLIRPFYEEDVKVTTLAHVITKEEAMNPNRVKVVRDRFSNAIYFSRAPIPYSLNMENENFLGHIGMYGFKMSALKLFSALEPGPLENIERLEQLRLLENQIPIRVAITPFSSVGVDRPEDIQRVIQFISKTNV